MRHLGRTLRVAISILVVAVPAILADPHVAHVIAANPFLDTYVPIASGIVYALWRAARPSTPPATSSSSGSPTMGAK